MNDRSNPPQGGTDPVMPDTDTAPEWDYHDPDEDTVESQEAATDEGDEQVAKPEEGSEDESTAEEAEESADEAEPPKAASVKLPDGSEVTLDELTRGYLRQGDYTRKTQEIAARRQSLAAEAQSFINIVSAFDEHLRSLIPPPPDPALAYRDPNGYVRAKAAHEAASGQVQKLLEIGMQARSTTEALDHARLAEFSDEQNRLLAERFPQTADETGRKRFFSEAASAAYELGFTQDELSGVLDHRLFALAHWAAKGLKAEQARQAAKQKVADVPPATPRKAVSKADPKIVEARRRLAKSGSSNDALKLARLGGIDFGD